MSGSATAAHRPAVRGAMLLLCGAMLGGCVPLRTLLHRPPPLRDAFARGFLVGAAVNRAQVTGADERGTKIVKSQYNSITAENVLKWQLVHPLPQSYDFVAADRYVEFGERNRMFVIGHTLVWHSQVPRWVFVDSAGAPLGRDSLLARMRDHILTVVGRYRGRVKGWDVVNEALNDDGTLRDSPWRQIIGDDYIAAAFRYAHEADPDAQLYYNDYDLENPAKRAGAVRLVRDLLAQGIPLTAVGTQEHNRLDSPPASEVEATITALAATGVHVNVTELDVDVLPAAGNGTSADVSIRPVATPATDPYPLGLPDSVQHRLTDRYAELFRVYWRHREVIDRVTFWGVRDGDSWLNHWPIRGRTSYPLLFDRKGKPKPAFAAIERVAR